MFCETEVTETENTERIGCIIIEGITSTMPRRRIVVWMIMQD